MKLLVFASLFLAGSAFAQEEPPITKLPKPKAQIEAIYPSAALRDRVSAVVSMELDISAEGHVEAVSLVSTATRAEDRTSESRPRRNQRPGESTVSSTISDYGFVRAATTAVSRMEFEPAEAGGAPVPVRIAYTYRFVLPPPPPPPPPPSTDVATTTVSAPQVLNFSGVLRERGTRRLLAGVVVTAFQSERGFESVTDGDGRFRFYDLVPGEWKVLAETDGYYPFRTAEKIEAGEALDVTYYLEKGSYNQYDVLVEAERPKKEVTRRRLAAAEIVKVPGTLGDPILVIENLPGVARPAFGSGNIIVRGSGPENTGVFIDGIEVPLVYHFGGFTSVVPANVIEDVEFYPGNFPVYYGRKTGGVFNANLKRLHPDQFHGAADVSILDAGLYLEIPIVDGLAVALAGRRSYIDGILKAVVPDDASVDLVSAPRYYDYQILTEFRPNNEHSIRAAFIGSHDQIELLFENPSDLDVQLSGGDVRAKTAFNRGWAIYEYTPSKTFSNELRFAAGRDKISASFFSEFYFIIDFLTFQLRDNARWKVLDNLTFAGGLDGVYRLIDIAIRSPLPPKEGDTSFSQDIDNVLETRLDNINDPEVGLYLDAEWKLFDQLVLIPGIRVDYYQRVKEFGVDPRLVVRWGFLPEWTLKGGIGLVHQQPDGDETDATFGNPDLSLESAIQYTLGGEWKPFDFLSIDLALFYNDLRRQVSRAGTEVIYDNNGKGKSYGLELFVRHDFHNNIHGWLSYTLSRSTRTESGETDERLFTYDQTHILNFNLSYTFPANWEVGIRWRLVSGNPYTPMNGGVLLSDFDRFAAVPGEVNSGRLPLFHQLDLRIEKRWIFDWWSISCYFNLFNTYNQGNVEAISYNFDFSETGSVKGLPLIPIIGIKGEL